DRLNRRNNIVVHKIVENENNSITEDKESTLNMLKEITGKDLSIEVLDNFKLGKRTENNQKPTPILIDQISIIFHLMMKY
ncbi:hypothetical protein ACDT12_13650, partial [Staphylococcus aureus]